MTLRAGILGRAIVHLVRGELVLVLHLGESDLLVDLHDDLVHFLSLAHLAEDVPLELQHRLLDDAVVKVHHVGRDLRFKLRILLHDWAKLLLTEPIGINMGKGLVKEFAALAEQVLVTANYGLLAELHMEVALLLVAEADGVLARYLLLLADLLRDDVNLLVHFVGLLKNVLLSRVEARFERLEHLSHELRVLRVFPAVVGRLRTVTVLLYAELDPEQVEEAVEEEELVDVVLDVVWQLSHEPLPRIALDRVVLVVCPEVLEVAFEALSHFLGQGMVLVEVGEQAEPLGELLAFLVIRRHVLKLE